MGDTPRGLVAALGREHAAALPRVAELVQENKNDFIATFIDQGGLQALLPILKRFNAQQ